MKESFSSRKSATAEGLKWLGRGMALSMVSLLPAGTALAAKANKNVHRDPCSSLSAKYHPPKAVLEEAKFLQKEVRHKKSVGFNPAIDAWWSPNNSSKFTCITHIPLEKHVDGLDELFSVRFNKMHGVKSAVVTPVPFNHKDTTDLLAQEPGSPTINTPHTYHGVLRNYEGFAYVARIAFDRGTIEDPFVGKTVDLNGGLQ